MKVLKDSFISINITIAIIIVAFAIAITIIASITITLLLGTQRLCLEHKVRLARLHSIFITQICPSRITGILSLLL